MSKSLAESVFRGKGERYWVVNGGGHRPEFFSDKEAALSECDDRNWQRSQYVPAATIALVDLVPVNEESPF